MKIAYITLHWPRIRQSGIGQKIQTQLAAWQKMDHEAQLFMHLSVNDSKEPLVPAEYFYYPQKSGVTGRFITEVSRIQAFKCLLRKVFQYKPDLIYLRWGMYVFPIQQLKDIAPVVVEINTNDVHEHRLLGLPLDIYNRLTRSLTLRNAAGLVCATQELVTAKEFTRFNLSTIVVSNGVDLSHIRPLPPPSNSIPSLIFIGTPGLAWHGVEKLIALAQHYPDINIDVVGYDTISGIEKVPDNIKFLGYLQRNEYREVVAHSDLAIGTLSLYENNMNEAAPLKIRDCLAHGLPVVLPYIDTDLNELTSDAILKIPNTPDNIETHGQAIHDFAYRMRGPRVPRELIAPLIDAQEKEKKRVKFFQDILDDKHSN